MSASAPTPAHHPPDELLAGYSAGTLSEGEELLVACHLTLCPACRRWGEALDRLGAELALRTEAADVPPLDALLAQVAGPGRAGEPRAPAPPAADPADLPAPLRRRIGALRDVPFRWMAPGISRFDLQRDGDRAIALLSLTPSAWIPPHRHAGVERGIVLAGAYVDETGRYRRGDVQIRQPDEPADHVQRIAPGGPCVLLMVDDGRKLATTAVGRLVGRLFDR